MIPYDRHGFMSYELNAKSDSVHSLVHAAVMTARTLEAPKAVRPERGTSLEEFEHSHKTRPFPNWIKRPYTVD